MNRIREKKASKRDLKLKCYRGNRTSCEWAQQKTALKPALLSALILALLSCGCGSVGSPVSAKSSETAAAKTVAPEPKAEQVTEPKGQDTAEEGPPTIAASDGESKESEHSTDSKSSPGSHQEISECSEKAVIDASSSTNANPWTSPKECIAGRKLLKCLRGKVLDKFMRQARSDDPKGKIRNLKVVRMHSPDRKNSLHVASYTLPITDDESMKVEAYECLTILTENNGSADVLHHYCGTESVSKCHLKNVVGSSPPELVIYFTSSKGDEDTESEENMTIYKTGADNDWGLVFSSKQHCSKIGRYNIDTNCISYICKDSESAEQIIELAVWNGEIFVMKDLNR